MFNKKIKSFGFIFLLLIGQQASILCYLPNKDYPSVKISTLDFLDGLYFNTQSFLSSNEPVIDDNNGDKIISPWFQYDLSDLDSALAEYSLASNQPVKNYLNTFTATQAKHFGESLRYEMIQDRRTLGFDMEAGFTLKDIMRKIDFSFTGKKAALNKDRFSNVDFFCNASTTALNSVATGVYRLNEEVSSKIKDPQDPDFVQSEHSDSELFLASLDKARDRMQSDLGFDTYTSDQSGLTDIVIKTGLKKCFYKSLRCKRVDVYAGLIFTFPTGVKASPDKALSFDFGFPVVTLGFIGGIDALLKRDLSAGLGYCVNFGYDAFETRRIPVQAEPSQLSPLLAKVFMRYGSTYSVTPYIQWKNVFMERLDARIGFAYTSHNDDALYLGKNSLNIISPLIRYPGGPSLKQAENISKMRDFSAWTARFVELKMNYRLGSNQAAELGVANCFLAFQKPFDSMHAIKSYRLTLGVNMIF